MFELKVSLGGSSLKELMEQDGEEVLSINLSAADEGDLGEECDGNQEPHEDTLGSLAQSSQDLLSCSNLNRVVNKMTPSPAVPAGPSCYQIRDRPILTGCLSSDWADQVEEDSSPGLPEDS